MSNKDIVPTVDLFFDWVYRRLEDEQLIVGLKHLEYNDHIIKIGWKHNCDSDCGCNFDQWTLEEAKHDPKGRQVMIEWIFSEYNTAKEQ